jgi:exo-beta-1,3-glucanase (GH17 family)
MERPGEWKNKSFDDPEVIQAYINYCRYMINEFNPDYFAYGLEVNEFNESAPDFDKLLILFDQVYSTLKQENPDLPIFVTLEMRYAPSKTKKLVQYSDYIAVSAYPYLEGYGNPEDIPSDYFSQMTEGINKPFAIAETSYAAEDLLGIPGLPDIEGNESNQAKYAQFLLNASNNMDAEFVVWFVLRDYDAMWDKIKDYSPLWWSVWKDAGLIDGDGNGRLGLEAWNEWLEFPKE